MKKIHSRDQTTVSPYLTPWIESTPTERETDLINTTHILPKQIQGKKKNEILPSDIKPKATIPPLLKLKRKDYVRIRIIIN